MTYRVIQWTTGNVGKSSVRAIAANPTLELVGCYAWSPEKVGRDVGELCGIEPLDVQATNDIDALLALKPDCVVYNPMFADVDDLVRILGRFKGSMQHRFVLSRITALGRPRPVCAIQVSCGAWR
jgi:2,4-diaminopentanoate dehydrogenase